MTRPTALTLLVVDDNAQVRRIISLWGSAMQVEVSCACDGKEAINLLITRHFDVILSALHMPGMSGWKLLAWLRKHRPEVLVCMMSSDTSSDTMNARFRAELARDVDGWLAKPFSIASLDRCIRGAGRNSSHRDIW
jgi:CheY-like chemotaxis protein